MENPILLKVRYSRSDGKNRLTWIRTFTNKNKIIEKIIRRNPEGEIIKRWNNEFTHWFNRHDITGVKADYERWGWTIVDYHPRKET